MYGPTFICISPVDNEWYPGMIHDGRNKNYRKTNRQFIRNHPDVEIIWLAPACEDCHWRKTGGKSYDREWCHDEVWDKCMEVSCQKGPVPYRRIDSF